MGIDQEIVVTECDIVGLLRDLNAMEHKEVLRKYGVSGEFEINFEDIRYSIDHISIRDWGKEPYLFDYIKRPKKEDCLDENYIFPLSVEDFFVEEKDFKGENLVGQYGGYDKEFIEGLREELTEIWKACLEASKPFYLFLIIT